MTTYIAGPMRGHPNFNFPEFHACESAIAGEGSLVSFPIHNPAAVDEHRYGADFFRSPTGDLADIPGFDLAAAMRENVRVIAGADDLVLLPGWRKSQGARLEAELAEMCGLRLWFWTPDSVRLRWLIRPAGLYGPWAELRLVPGAEPHDGTRRPGGGNLGGDPGDLGTRLAAHIRQEDTGHGAPRSRPVSTGASIPGPVLEMIPSAPGNVDRPHRVSRETVTLDPDGPYVTPTGAEVTEERRNGVARETVVLDPFDPFDAALIPIVATNRRKRADYARDGDPFDNFRQVAAATGQTPVQVVTTLMAVKEARLLALSANNREPANESVADTVLDAAVYATIRLALISEAASI